MTMHLGNEVIEIRWFPDGHLLIEGYLQGLKLDLLEQNDDLVRVSKSEPRFEVRVGPDKITSN